MLAMGTKCESRVKEQKVAINKLVAVCGRFNMHCHVWYPLIRGVASVPPFEESVTMAMQHIGSLDLSDRAKITTFSALFDEVVPYAASSLPDVKNYRVPFLFHFPAIYWQFTFPRRLIAALKEIPSGISTI